MRSSAKHLWSDQSGAIAAVYALALPALIAVGGIAFDYARMAALDTELQQAADQAALAAASQLDGQPGACNRAAKAASVNAAGDSGLLDNKTLFANEAGGGRNVQIATEFDDASGDPNVSCDNVGNIKFYSSYTNSATNVGATTAATAKFVSVTVNARKAVYALTPIVAAIDSGNLTGTAVAGLGAAICKVPPVMLCNPDEPVTNTDEDLALAAAPGTGLRLITGNATAAGNFGWLETGIDTGGSGGANALKGALGYNTPPGECVSPDGVATKTGMSTSVLDALNTRFDVFSNGNSDCPNNPGGTCSPSRNARKDLVCDTNNNSSTSCKNDGWDESSNPYRPSAATFLKADGSEDPSTMGYPRDLCHAVKASAQTCGVKGSGTWDRDAYFRVNYGWTTESAWTTATGLSATVSRYGVYTWELANPSVVVGSENRGIDVPQRLGGNKAAFSYPATGRAGQTPGGATADRRRISVAVLNCKALDVKGKTTGIKPPLWLDVFLVEPAWTRGSGVNAFTDKKDVYVEVIGPTTPGGAGSTAGQVVRRDKPYLIE